MKAPTTPAIASHHRRGARAISTAAPAPRIAEMSSWMPSPLPASASQLAKPCVTMP